MQRRPAPMLVSTSLDSPPRKYVAQPPAPPKLAWQATASTSHLRPPPPPPAWDANREQRESRRHAAIASRPPPLHREAPPLVAHHSLLRGAARAPPPLPSKKASLRRHTSVFAAVGRSRRSVFQRPAPAPAPVIALEPGLEAAHRELTARARHLLIELVNERPVYRPAPKLPTSILAFDGGSATPSAAARKPTPDAAARAWRFAEIMSAGDG